MSIHSNEQCSEGHFMEGHLTRLGGFNGQEFYLAYAGWDDQWIVRNSGGDDMLRATTPELSSYLICAPEKAMLTEPGASDEDIKSFMDEIDEEIDAEEILEFKPGDTLVGFGPKNAPVVYDFLNRKVIRHLATEGELSVTLQASGIKSFRVYADQVGDLQTAFCQFRDGWALGSSAMGGGVVRHGKETVGHISYNGKYWLKGATHPQG